MRKWAVGLLAVAVLLSAAAAELEGVSLPNTVTAGGATLHLNGMGVRVKKVAFIGVKVYVAGLYLAEKSSDPAKILAADAPRQLIMHFLYKEVGKAKLVEAWNEGFEKNAGDKSGALKARIETFNGFWPDMKSGDRAVLTYIPGTGVEVEIKGQKAGTIEGKDFADALFSIWLGPNPPNEDLKNGLLGK